MRRCCHLCDYVVCVEMDDGSIDNTKCFFVHDCWIKLGWKWRQGEWNWWFCRAQKTKRSWSPDSRLKKTPCLSPYEWINQGVSITIKYNSIIRGVCVFPQLCNSWPISFLFWSKLRWLGWNVPQCNRRCDKYREMIDWAIDSQRCRKLLS